MSKIDKLSILGVRSFDNTRSETIAFHSPLTLIVGLNGSGKTTIIECLKYATTGELPPNAKTGGAFIHDPKLCGEKEVLAQVKVRFKSQDGVTMVCTRNLQLTVKKNARSMKTLEGNILMMRDAERMTMSSRVAEMDVRYDERIYPRIWFETKTDFAHLNQTMMPAYLGVSRAILDSVIFCHQEESLWPLAEPSKLKVRFDEIFEALKYTKAIESIKVMQKQKKDELKNLQKDEEMAKANKDRADKNQKQTMALSDEIEALRAKSDEKGEEIKEETRKAERAWKVAEEAGTIVAQLEGKRIAEKTKNESVQSLRENLTEMSDSDAELQQMLEQYEERVHAYEADVDEQKYKWQDLRKEIDESRARVSTKDRECGSYEAQQQKHEEQIQDRERLIKETARSHNIRGFDTDIDDAQVRAFMERITKMARDQNAAFERARADTQEKLQAAQKDLNSINEKKSALNSSKESSRQTISANDKKISSLQDGRNKVDVDEGGKVALEARLRESEAKRDSLTAEMASANWDSTIESIENDLRELDERKEKLDAELVEGTRQAGDTARLDHMQKELADRQRSLETMTGAHGNQITSIVGDGWTPATLEDDFRRAIEHHQSQVADAEKQRDGTGRESEQLTYKLETLRKDLKGKQSALKAAEKAIRDAVDVEPAEYPEEVRKMEETRDFNKADVDAFTKVLEYFDSCIKVANENNGCKTCSRSFLNDKEREKMLNAMAREKKKYEGGSKVKQELENSEQDLQAARAVSSDFDTWERLKQKEIPQLQKEEKKLVDSREALVAQLEEQDTRVNERQSGKRDAEAMSRTVQNIVKYHNDITSYEGQIKELTAKQKASGLSRGLEVIQQETKKINEEAKAVRSRLTKTTGDRDRAKAQQNQLNLDISDTHSKLNTAEYKLREKASLDGQINDYKKLTADEREKVKSYDQEIQSLAPQLSQAQAKYEDIARRGADKDRELQAETNKLNSSLNQLKLADQAITAYLDKGGPDQLKRARRELDNIREEIKKLEGEQSQITRDVKQLEDQLRNHAETKRSISDNQRYRRDLRALQDIRKELEQLEATNAEAEYASAQKEGSKHQMVRNKLAGEQAHVIGELKSKDDQLQQLIDDYKTEYKGAARSYRASHIKVETTKACVDDLGRYSGALDKAIMKFHSIKMEEINNIIGELWRKTYQGTDVDTILIRSESETGKANKSYNYRVCMVKQDAEMDMRGRCSAGQKVLASIIIRLALAECFGVNCGLIALDEPTTNLDRDNIRALAQSLAEIIKLRRQQPNFQLIVITHDEDFLREMGCQDFADYYYRVSRNEKQKSVIKMQSISEVGDGFY